MIGYVIRNIDFSVDDYEEQIVFFVSKIDV
jgi:hypothetical protein